MTRIGMGRWLGMEGGQGRTTGSHVWRKARRGFPGRPVSLTTSHHLAIANKHFFFQWEGMNGMRESEKMAVARGCKLLANRCYKAASSTYLLYKASVNGANLLSYYVKKVEKHTLKRHIILVITSLKRSSNGALFICYFQSFLSYTST